MQIDVHAGDHWLLNTRAPAPLALPGQGVDGIHATLEFIHVTYCCPDTALMTQGPAVSYS